MAVALLLALVEALAHLHVLLGEDALADVALDLARLVGRGREEVVELGHLDRLLALVSYKPVPWASSDIQISRDADFLGGFSRAGRGPRRRNT